MLIEGVPGQEGAAAGRSEGHGEPAAEWTQMTIQCDFKIDGRQCIYVAGHSREHYAPEDSFDHSDEIRLRVLRDSNDRMALQLAAYRKALEPFALMHRAESDPEELACQRGIASDATYIFSGNFAIASLTLESPDPGAALLAEHAAELEKLGKEVSEERKLKREVLDKYADYCIERNEHVTLLDAMRQRAEAADQLAELRHIEIATKAHFWEHDRERLAAANKHVSDLEAEVQKAYDIGLEYMRERDEARRDSERLTYLLNRLAIGADNRLMTTDPGESGRWFWEFDNTSDADYATGREAIDASMRWSERVKKDGE